MDHIRAIHLFLLHPQIVNVSTHFEKKNLKMERNLWLLGRPVRKVRRGSFVPGAILGVKFPLAHWGLLCTELNVEQIEYWTGSSGIHEAIQDEEPITIGMIFELARGENDVNSVSTTPSLSSTFHRQWQTFIKQYIGRTTLTDAQIMEQGTITPFSNSFRLLYKLGD
jgi:hypothetical protein